MQTKKYFFHFSICGQLSIYLYRRISKTITMNCWGNSPPFIPKVLIETSCGPDVLIFWYIYWSGYTPNKDTELICKCKYVCLYSLRNLGLWLCHWKTNKSFWSAWRVNRYVNAVFKRPRIGEYTFILTNDKMYIGLWLVISIVWRHFFYRH